MSLTQIVEASNSKKFLKQFLNKPKMESFTNSVEPSTNRYSRMGVAFDYAFRFGLKHRLGEKANSRSGLVAEASVHIVVKEMYPEYYLRYSGKLEEAVFWMDEFEISQSEEGRIAAKAAFELADLEPIFRTKMVFPFPEITESEVDELIALYDLIDFTIFEDSEHVFLNPVFGEGSRKVGGADGDIIVDDMLIDIKTTKHTKFTPEMLRQLVGYSLLANRFGINDEDGNIIINEIKKMAVYFSRSGRLFVMDLDECVNQGDQETVINFILNHEMARTDVEI